MTAHESADGLPALVTIAEAAAYLGITEANVCSLLTARVTDKLVAGPGGRILRGSVVRLKRRLAGDDS